MEWFRQQDFEVSLGDLDPLLERPCGGVRSPSEPLSAMDSFKQNVLSHVPEQSSDFNFSLNQHRGSDALPFATATMVSNHSRLHQRDTPHAFVRVLRSFLASFA